MNSVDLMGIAIEWLDCYQASDLFIVDLYADDASLLCDCDGVQELRGRAAIEAYWRQRFVETPADEITNLNLFDGGIIVSYRVPGGVVNAILFFDGKGKIRRSRCALS